jgi:hypothetical protein
MSTSALEAWNSIDQFTETFDVYNCAFLDILGYKQKAVDYFDQRFNLYGRINRALTKASVAQNLTAMFIDTSGLTVEIISDSIIMLQPAQTSGLGPLLPFACHFASLLSFEGLLIRGGIGRGRHTRKTTKQGFGFLASEALQKAYHLESTIAVYPRILIDRDLVPYLPHEELGLVIREQDNFILHFAHHVINREGANAADVHGEMSELYLAMTQTVDEGIRAKYQWLLDYYYWTLDQNPNWNSDDFRSFSSGFDRGFAEIA